MDLFSTPSAPRQRGNQPLAERMRPQTLDDFVGQEHLLGSGKLLRELVGAGKLKSLILWGPPGSGKTTLAQIIANSANAICVHFSAVASGVKDLKKIIQEAEDLQRAGKNTVLFVDEIHHFNKSQQDNFLPYVEKGTLVLIGATTENPSFEVISPLLSRCQVLVLNPLSPDAIGQIIDRALQRCRTRPRQLGPGYCCRRARFFDPASPRRLSRRFKCLGNRRNFGPEDAKLNDQPRSFARGAAAKSAVL